jgi:hypothetical protein
MNTVPVGADMSAFPTKDDLRGDYDENVTLNRVGSKPLTTIDRHAIDEAVIIQ